ncbi:MAG: C25 family cysteine peptidase [Candidatus Fermentibacteria bacterium]
MLKLGIFVLLAAVSISHSENIVFEFSLDTNEIQLSQWMNEDVVSIPGGVVPFEDGDPSLQGISYTYLLPQGTTITDVAVDVHDEVIFDGKFDITPVNYLILSEPFVSADRSSAYFSETPFPSSPVEQIACGNRTGFRLGSFTLVPFSYNPLSGELSVITSATVTVECSPDPEALDISLTSRQINTAAAGLQGIVNNPSRIADYAPAVREATDGDPVWVAIGTGTFETILQPLVDHRNQYTGESEYVTVEWIEANYSGWDTQEKIRNYLKDQFYNHSLVYALMVGDYGPTTRISSLYYPAANEYLDDVTDHYYMDLDGTWDYDGDHLYGEANDGLNYYSDLYVGRFSTNSTNLMQNMVDKTLYYATTPPAGSWQKTAVLIGAGLWPPNYWGSFVCEDIDDFIPADWTVEKLYETSGGHPNNQIDVINAGCSFVAPQGHGYAYGIFWYYEPYTHIISTSNYTQLTNIDRLAVFHSMSCTTGKLTATSIAERLMFSDLGGAVAVMFNSSYGWGTPPAMGPSEWLEVHFAEQLFTNQIYEIGVAQAFAKDALQAMTGVPLTGWVIQENNLLGDPALVFVSGQTGIEGGQADNAPQPALGTPFPNPLSGNCSISYDMPVSGTSSITVYDLTGRAVRSIYSGSLPVGTGNVTFDGNDASGNPLPPGCYAVVLNSPAGTASTMMLVAR